VANPPTKNAPIEQNPAIISTFLNRALPSVGPGRAAMRQGSVHFQQSIPAPNPRAIETIINEVCMGGASVAGASFIFQPKRNGPSRGEG
jgi:hypothetical protein